MDTSRFIRLDGLMAVPHDALEEVLKQASEENGAIAICLGGDGAYAVVACGDLSPRRNSYEYPAPPAPPVSDEQKPEEPAPPVSEGEQS